MYNLLKIIWRFRQFILSSIRTEFAANLARSRLGVAWVVLNPLLQSAILAFVLSGVLALRLPHQHQEGVGGYALYLLAGMLAWSPFTELITRSLTIFINNGNLLKKLAFPRLCLPLITAGSALINNVFLILATLFVSMVLGKWPSLQILWLPVLTGLTIALALSAGIILGIINVFVRDVGHIVNIILQFMFWMLPIIYSPQQIPANYRLILELNPLYHLVVAYQRVLVFDQPPGAFGILYAAAVVLILMVMAFALFRRASPEMVDVL